MFQYKLNKQTIKKKAFMLNNENVLKNVGLLVNPKVSGKKLVLFAFTLYPDLKVKSDLFGSLSSTPLALQFNVIKYWLLIITLQ